MPTTFTKGDMFQTEGLRAYAFGCHCAGSMDRGIAVAFKKKWPLLFEEYAARCAAKSLHPGDVLDFHAGDERVYALALQENASEKPKWPALIQAVKAMVELAERAGIAQIALPRIGAGAGATEPGLDWTRTKKILSEIGAESTVSLVVFEQFVRSM